MELSKYFLLCNIRNEKIRFTYTEFILVKNNKIVLIFDSFFGGTFHLLLELYFISKYRFSHDIIDFFKFKFYLNYFVIF